jgi:hypothetical protein
MGCFDDHRGGLDDRDSKTAGLEFQLVGGFGEAAGLTTLACSELAAAPTLPMMPGTWDAEHAAGDNT